MIERKRLLDDLQKLLPRIEADLFERTESAEVPEVGDQLRREFEAAKQAERTAQSYSEWRLVIQVTQAACVGHLVPCRAFWKITGLSSLH